LQDGKDSSAGKLRKDAVICFWHHETADFKETNFEKSVSQARLLYSAFVERGIHDGRKPELGGGGLIWRLGYDFNGLVSRVAALLNLEPDKVGHVFEKRQAKLLGRKRADHPRSERDQDQQE
jgi:hypothetical protein